MYYRYRERIRNRYWAIAIICILVLLAILGAPRIKDIQPSPGSNEIPSTAPIRIDFNQPMDRVSVETRLTIEPEIAGSFLWEGNSFTFIPTTQWPQGGEVKVHLAAGSRSTYFLPLLTSKQWSFRITNPRIVFLLTENAGSVLFTSQVEGQEKTQLIQSSSEIFDFDVCPDGTMISYTIMREDGGSNLRIFDLVSEEDRLAYECPSPSRCQNPRLSPDNNLLVFEKVELQAGVGGKWLEGFPQVFSVKIAEGSQAIPVGSMDHIHSDPVWSPEGYLGFFDETAKEIEIVDLKIPTDPIQVQAIPSELGIVGTWSPEGEFFVFPDVVILDETYEKNKVTGDEFPLFYSHIFRLSISTGLVFDLSGTDFGLVEDASPVYSPDGLWIAFTRKYLESDRWSLGRQLWLMRADGSEARQITDEPEYNHFSIAWSPDSKRFTCARINQNNLTQPPEIWLFDLESDELLLLESQGYLPQWLP
jgi:TolB protein